MGHIRLGRLPTSRRWKQVVGLLRRGGSVANLAAATARAAESELQSARGDPALGAAVWLLTQLPRAARSQRFAHELATLGFDRGAEQSLFSLTASFSNAVDRNGAAQSTRTDLGELAVQAAGESLTAVVSAQTPSLFDSTADDLQRVLGQLATKDRFASLDLLKVGGENVDPAEVESFLLTHPDIAQVQVVGVPDPRLSEVVCACIVPVLDRSVTLDDLTAFRGGKLASFKIPRHTISLTEFPMTASGKPQKFKLREMAAARLKRTGLASG